MNNRFVPDAFIYEPPMDPYLEVVHADPDFIILNKQSGLLSVPGKDPGLSDCLESRARKQYPTASTIHRLDKDTSGIVVMGLNKPAHAKIGAQFENRTAKKSYIARVWGHVAQDTGRVDLPIALDWERKPRQRIDPVHGRPAQTDWEVVAREEGGVTRVRLFPLTGRTHQLRVHMLALGHPMLGDNFYADGAVLDAAPRLQLHAETLEFAHPDDGRSCRFVVPAPF